MDRDLHDNVACAGYGAINVILRLLSSQLGTLAARIKAGDYTAVDVFLATADGMATALDAITTTPVWDDARRQMLSMLRQYRDLIAQASTRHRSEIEPALAETLEAHAILVVARDRLGRRLGFHGD